MNREQELLRNLLTALSPLKIKGTPVHILDRALYIAVIEANTYINNLETSEPKEETNAS